MEGFGLWTSSPNGTEAQPVALTGVRLAARISALGQQTCVEQVFINREQRPIEALYTFPLPENAAVCAFEVLTGERVLTGAIEELAKGMEQYDKALSEGHGAFMAELWRPDVFSTRIGNLKPGQAVLVRLTYLADVDLADRRLRLSFPTTLAPRYGTATGMDPLDALVESDALNPPHILCVPYGLEISVEIDLGLKLKSLASPTHGLRVEPGEGTAWKATLAGGRAEMNRNIIIEAELAREPGARAVLEPGLDAGESFAAVTFLPEFETADLDAPAPREIVFLLDCSGSMEGPSIDQAKRALALCLKCLNEGDRFNICCFGSSFQLMKPESVLYTQASLDAALAHVAGIHASLGGTELHAPLEALLTTARDRLLRDIVLLTDGQVSNEPAILKLAAAHRGRARIFAFGIGPASSEFLVKGVARATAGASDFIAAGERIEDKVLRMFARLASPRLENVEIDWHGARADAEPSHPAALFDGEPLRVAARFSGTTPREVTLRATWQGRRKEWHVPIEHLASAGISRDSHPLLASTWARARLAALELTRGDGQRAAIVDLSRRYHILSRETTFIAIEHRSLEERTRGLPAQRRIPVMLAAGWGGHPTMDLLAGAPAPMLRCAPAAAPCMPAESARFAVRKRRRGSPDVSLGRELTDAAPQPLDPLHALLLGQSAEGWFAADPLLDQPTLNGNAWNVAPLRQQLDALTASLATGLQPKALATALVLRALHDCFPAREPEWRLAAQKARRWLAKHAPATKAWVEAAQSVS